MDKNTLHALLRKMVETDASDLFLTVGAPPHIKVQGESWPLSVPPLQSGQAQALAYSIMSAQQIADFERQLVANLSYSAPDIGRIPVSVSDLDATYVVVSSHKLGGPSGAGALVLAAGAPFFARLLSERWVGARRAATEAMLARARAVEPDDPAARDRGHGARGGSGDPFA